MATEDLVLHHGQSKMDDRSSEQVPSRRARPYLKSAWCWYGLHSLLVFQNGRYRDRRGRITLKI